MTKPQEQLEQIEHAQHGAQDRLNRNVAMTMAVVAALLACVTMLSHRSHNETLQLQNESNKAVIEANVNHTRATDQWGYFQAKNIRSHMYQVDLKLLSVLARQPDKESERASVEKEWKGKVDKYEDELKGLEAEARGLVKEAEKKEEEAKHKLEESHHSHQRGTRFDISELAVEISLVLCALAILSKQRVFWLAGIGCGVIGVVIALSAFMIH